MRSRGKRTSSLSLHPELHTHIGLHTMRAFLQRLLKCLRNLTWIVDFLTVWRKPPSLCRNMHTDAGVRTQSYSFRRHDRRTASSTESSLMSSLLQDGSEGVPCEPLGLAHAVTVVTTVGALSRSRFWFIASCLFLSTTAALACFSLEDHQPREPPDPSDPLAQSWRTWEHPWPVTRVQNDENSAPCPR